MPRKSYTPLQKSITGAIERTGYQFTLPDLEAMGRNIDQVATANPMLAAAIRAIIKNVNQPNLRVWDNKAEKDAAPDVMYLMANPNVVQDYSAFVKFNVFQYLFDGNTYIRKIRDGKRVMALLPLPYGNITPELVGGVSIVYRDATGATYDRADIIHWKDSDFGNSYLTGMSPLKHLVFSLTNSSYADQYNKGIMENGGQPAGYLKTDAPLLEKDAVIYQERWAARNGLKSSGKTPVMGNGVQYVTTGTQMKDMGYQALKKITTQEILAIYKVPPVEVGITDGSNYANSQVQMKIFWSNTIKPIMDGFASIMTAELLHKELGLMDLEFYYDYSNIPVMQDDLSTRLDIAMKAASLGFSLESIAANLEIPFDVADIDHDQGTNEPTTDQNDLNGDDQPVDDQTDEKRANVAKAADHAFRESLKDVFIKAHKNAEKRFTNDLQKFYVNARNKILDLLKSKGSDKAAMAKAVDLETFNLIQQYITDPDVKDQLAIIANDNLVNASDEVVTQYLNKLNIEYVRDSKTDKIILAHGQNIKVTWDTVTRTVQEVLADGIKENWSSAQMADEIRRVFDITRDRSITIARTEITSVSNDLIQNQFKVDGFTQKEWLTADDGAVRPTHAAQDGKTVGLDEKFPNGLEYPGDPSSGDAGEVVNCRCTLLPK